MAIGQVKLSNLLILLLAFFLQLLADRLIVPDQASLLAGMEGCSLQILEVKDGWVLEEVSDSHRTLCVERDNLGADAKTVGTLDRWQSRDTGGAGHRR